MTCKEFNFSSLVLVHCIDYSIARNDFHFIITKLYHNYQRYSVRLKQGDCFYLQFNEGSHSNAIFIWLCVSNSDIIGLVVSLHHHHKMNLNNLLHSVKMMYFQKLVPFVLRYHLESFNKIWINLVCHTSSTTSIGFKRDKAFKYVAHKSQTIHKTLTCGLISNQWDLCQVFPEIPLQNIMCQPGSIHTWRLISCQFQAQISGEMIAVSKYRLFLSVWSST